MPLNYDSLMALSAVDTPCNYTARDARLYALACGFGNDPRELPFLVESLGHSTVPTMATSLADRSLLADCGWDYSRVLHSEQKMELYLPLPQSADLLLNSRVDSVIDRGTDRDAMLTVVTEARLARDETAMFRSESVLIARGQGGFGGPDGRLAEPHPIPDREPDLSCDLPVRPDQGLLFALCGDDNPLHLDPAAAKRAGFEQPILHGLCSYGIACRAILRTICDFDFTLINGFDVRFSAPVFPGDVLTTDMWQQRNVVSFRSTVKSRDSVVLRHGRCLLTG